MSDKRIPDPEDDRRWWVFPQVIPDQWTTPHITVAFGRYWKVYIGLGPFYLTVGYVEMF